MNLQIPSAQYVVQVVYVICYEEDLRVRKLKRRTSDRLLGGFGSPSHYNERRLVKSSFHHHDLRTFFLCGAVGVVGCARTQGRVQVRDVTKIHTEPTRVV